MLAAETPPLLELRTLAAGGWSAPVLLHQGDPVSLPSRLQQRLLLRVGCAGGRLVSRDDLVQTLWPVHPPRTARELLSSHVARLRRVLSACTPAAAAALPRSEDGYRIDPELLRVDVVELARAVQHGGGRADLVLAALRRLPAVRGDADLVDQDWWARAHRLGWQHVRELCRLLLEHPDGSIRTDVPWVDLVPTLERLAEHSPYDEPVVAWLVEGLALTGRSAVALQTVADTRERLVTELGADPSPPLREAYDLALTTSTETTCTENDGGRGPARLVVADPPPPPLDLVGREPVVAELAGRLVRTGSDPVRLMLLGAPGVGTSAVAAAVAARVAGFFGGGVHHIDLADPQHPAGLRAPTREDTPETGAPVLWVVDHLDPQRPLPPAASRAHLLATGSADHPDLLSVDPVRVLGLDREGSRALLEVAVGGPRLAAEPVALTDLVLLCGGRPGALRRAAVRLSGDPALTLAALVRLWRDPGVRLQEVSGGPGGVAASFDRALAALEPWLRECLDSVAQASAPVHADHLARVGGITPGRAVAGCRALAARGLLRSEQDRWWAEELLVAHLRHDGSRGSQPEGLRG